MPETPELEIRPDVGYVEDGAEVDLSNPSCLVLWEEGSSVKCGREAGHPGHHFHIELERFTSGAWLW